MECMIVMARGVLDLLCVGAYASIEGDERRAITQRVVLRCSPQRGTNGKDTFM